MAATFDVDAAYRQIPVRVEDQPHTVVMWDDLFYLDGRVPFGAASSNGLFARCGDAMSEIGPTPPDNPPPFSEQAIYDYAKQFRWPWKVSKTSPFGSVFRYLGFDWNIETRRVSIPDEKRAKYLTRVESWRNSPRVSLHDTEILVGSLVHCTLAIPEGKPQLAGLISFMAAMDLADRPRFSHRPPSQRALADISWWSARLATPHEGMAIAPPPPPAPFFICTDASTSFGLGLTFDSEFISIPLRPNWAEHGRDIGWAKAIAVEMAIHWLAHRGISNSSVTINCDNQGVVYAWAALRSRNQHQNSSIARAFDLATSLGLRITVTYIRTDVNPADAPSRNAIPPDLSLARNPPPIPEHLANYMYYA